jgi:hypothetical protein
MTAVMNENCIDETFFLGSLYKRANLNFVLDGCMTQKYYEINKFASEATSKKISFNLFTLSDTATISVPSFPVFSASYLCAIYGPTLCFSYNAFNAVKSNINLAKPLILIVTDMEDWKIEHITNENIFSSADLVIFPNEYIKQVFDSRYSGMYRKAAIILPQSAEDYIRILQYATKEQKSTN